MKLLGGSHHGKIISVTSGAEEIRVVKRQSKRSISSFNDFSMQDDPAYPAIMYEVYIRRKVRNVIPVMNSLNFIVETRAAYVCKGSNVKSSTIFKFGDLVKRQTITTEMLNGAL